MSSTSFHKPTFLKWLNEKINEYELEPEKVKFDARTVENSMRVYDSSSSIETKIKAYSPLVIENNCDLMIQ